MSYAVASIELESKLKYKDGKLVLASKMCKVKKYYNREEYSKNSDLYKKVASTTASEVDGVSAMMSANVSDLMGGKKMSAKGVRVEMDGEAIAVNLFIVVRYGSAIGDVAKKVQQMVRTALEGMTGFRVAAVNVHVGGISFN